MPTGERESWANLQNQIFLKLCPYNSGSLENKEICPVDLRKPGENRVYGEVESFARGEVMMMTFVNNLDPAESRLSPKEPDTGVDWVKETQQRCLQEGERCP